MKTLVSLVSAIALAGCASAPAVYNFDNSAVIARGYDATWAAVSEFFTSNNIQIKTIEKDSGVIYAERMNQSPRVPGKIGDIGDCGSPGIESVFHQSVQLNVFVRPMGGETRMTVNTTMNETRCSGGIGGGCMTVSCNSTGKLEQSLIDFARKS